ncbi:MAG: LysR substrate-binding domain-containing protein [Pseudomonadota bacterium]
MSLSPLPPLTMLRAFEAAVRLGGFSAAGRELNVTHAAVAQQVRALEARLGIALMHRGGRGMAATPSGERLALGLARGLDAMRRAVETVEAEAAEQPVRVTLTPAFSAHWLLPRVGGFRASHPGIELLLSPSVDVVDLTEGGFDLAIRFGTGQWRDHDVRLLIASAHAVVATPALLARHPVEAPEDLLALPWVQEIGTEEWAVWLAARGVETAGKRDILHLPGFMAVAAMRAGEGVGLTARTFVEQDIAEGRLVALFDQHGPVRTGYHLVRPPGPLRPAVAAFIGWLQRMANDDTTLGDATG